MPWTPLHRALGETSSTLDFELIKRACDRSVPESAELDWKRKLPLTAGREDHRNWQNQQQELAKDIAAMANSGGGMIVYGVAESSSAGTSAANNVEPVGAVDETTIKAIRQVSGMLVYPPVVGLELLRLAPADNAEGGVLVLLVPDSSDTPHLVRPKNKQEWFGAPYRHGPETEWMVERQLATAYITREIGRRRRREDFDSRFAAFISTLSGDDSTSWVVIQGVPDVPLTHPRELQPLTAGKIIDRAWQCPLVKVVDSFGPCDLTEGTRTRRGLQRYYRHGRRDIHAAPNAVAQGRIEVHGDGSVFTAFTSDGAIPGEGRQPGHVPIADIESTSMDFFALLWQVRQELRVSSDYKARLTVHPPTQIFRRPDYSFGGHMSPWDKERILGYSPVDGPIITSEGFKTALESWINLVEDAVNQAGHSCSLRANEILTALLLND